MNELALFAGAGGGILGGKLLGWTTICAVEWDAYARDVLVARQNDGCLEPFPIWDDVQTFDGRPWRGRVDVVSGGFPCQDISAAGKGVGIDGARSGMWVEMARIIGEVRPRFVFVENSPMLTSRGLGRVLGDLASLGYDARWGVLGAVDAGAPHKRERIWIVAHSMPAGKRREQRQGQAKADAPTHATSEQCDSQRAESTRLIGPSRPTNGRDEPANTARLHDGCSYTGKTQRQAQESRKGSGSDHVADIMRERSEAGSTNSERREKGLAGITLNCREDVGNAHRISGRPRAGRQDGAEAGDSDWWTTEPDVGRVAHGVANRVDRLRCLGNGQVPAVAALAWQILNPDGAWPGETMSED